MMESSKKNKDELFMDFDVLNEDSNGGRNSLLKEGSMTETVKLKSV